MSQAFRTGGFATTSPTDIICLRGAVQTSGRVSTLRLATPYSAGYAVTVGKTFYICRIIIAPTDGDSTNVGFSFGYADNDVGLDSTTARTNPVPVFGNPEQTTASLAGGILLEGNLQAHQDHFVHGWETLIIKAAPAGKYMYVKGFFGSVKDVQVWGFEA